MNKVIREQWEEKRGWDKSENEQEEDKRSFLSAHHFVWFLSLLWVRLCEVKLVKSQVFQIQNMDSASLHITV